MTDQEILNRINAEIAASETACEDPADWAWETWRSDGRYMVEKESSMDLMEVQE